MTIAYLVNQYPQTSQSFIRREIAALEAQGIPVQRYTLRRWDQKLIDPRDEQERQRTRAVLETGAGGLTLATLRAAVTRPGAFFRALATAIRHGRRSGKSVALHLVYLAEACVLERWLREGKVGHVHAHFGTNSATVAMLCRMLGGPTYSFTSHGPEEYDKPEAISLAEKVSRSRFVVAISSFGRSQLYRWCDYRDWPKVQVVRCGVDELFLRPGAGSGSAEVPPPPAEPRLVNVGRLGASKGQLFLIEAAGRLAAEGMKFELTLVGDGPMRDEIERLIERLNLKTHVRLAGWMSNDAVRQEILRARAMCLPSFAEGLPLVIMESLALHRPVISTYVAGIPELVEPGVCGWLVPPGSTDELTAAMRDALTAPPERLAEMGRIGARRVAERHDVAKEAARLAALFRGEGTNGSAAHAATHTGEHR